MQMAAKPRCASSPGSLPWGGGTAASLTERSGLLGGAAHHLADIDMTGRQATHEAAIDREHDASDYTRRVRAQQHQRAGLFRRRGVAAERFGGGIDDILARGLVEDLHHRRLGG